MKSLDDLLKRIGEGGRVALEGSPIYLDTMPTADHKRSYKVLWRIAKYLRERDALVSAYVLLDEYNCEEADGARAAHLAAAAQLNPVVLLESAMQDGALKVLGEIHDQYLQTPHGKSLWLRNPKGAQPRLLGSDGSPRCALLDAAFQLGKTVDGERPDINIVVHPHKMLVGDTMVNFKEQQEGVLAVLRSRRPQNGPHHEHLPWSVGVVHIWLDENGAVCEASLTRNKGRSTKQITLPGWRDTQW